MDQEHWSELKRIITINSWTKNKAGVDAVGAVFVEWLTPLGYTLRRHPRGEIGDHLHFVAPPPPDGDVPKKRMLLLGHLDTVFPPGEFETFSEDEAWIYGPGVCDMKGGNYVIVEALRRLHAAHGALHSIDVLLVSDEETGSDDSQYLTRELAHDYDACLVFEAAGRHDEVVIGRKGVGTFFIDITGRAAHAGNHYADGADANLEASHKLQALVALTDLKQETTINVGEIHGGIGANTISPSARLTFELRYTSAAERDRVLEAVEALVAHAHVPGTIATLSGGIQRDVMAPTEAQHRLIEQIETLCGIELATERRGGVSDANLVAAEGVPTLDGWGPFGDGDHTVHERASKRSFVDRIALTTEVLGYWMEGKICPEPEASAPPVKKV